MAKTTLSLLLLLLPIFFIAGSGNATPATSATNFIKSSCSITRYPAVCVQSLSVYASAIQQNPRQLAQTALSVSLTQAQSTKSFVSKVTKMKGMKGREIGAVKDCLETMSDSVDRLSKSIEELGHMGQAKGQDFLWHMSNVQTWVSAALTDETTCLDGFSSQDLNGKVKAAIKARVDNVAHVTSNALALVNKFAEKH